MRHDFDAIPDAAGDRCNAGSMLTRIYHAIGLAAVADALGLITAEFDRDLPQSIETGEFSLIPLVPQAATIDRAA